MESYKQFLVYFKNNGYTFMDFKEFHYANKEELPEKLLVLRHDIHHRDIPNGYKMMEIEREVLGKVNSTFFVMLDCDQYKENSRRPRYLKLIKYCITNNIDVQPHISPLNYLNTTSWSWKANNIAVGKDSTKVDAITPQITENYRHKQNDSSSEIIIKKKDIFNIKSINKYLIKYLKEYNKKWKEITGNNPLGYSAHGNDLLLNRIIHNGILLDQKEIIDANLFKYEVYSTQTRNYLNLLSDNSQPYWITNPELIKTGRYQLLAHPYVWSNQNINNIRQNYKKNIPYYSMYPYLGPIDIITNFSEYLDSKLDLNEYNNKYKKSIMY